MALADKPEPKAETKETRMETEMPYPPRGRVEPVRLLTTAQAVLLMDYLASARSGADGGNERGDPAFAPTCRAGLDGVKT